MKINTDYFKSFIYCLFFLSLILLSTNSFGAIINVPTSAYPTIQAGIDAAFDGDIVLLADGTYTGAGNKNIDFKGKAITVQSENGPTKCIINCEGVGRGFYFHSFETNQSILSGLTIINGYWEGINAGGIYCANSAPKITNCIIKNCYAAQWGGGISFAGSAGADNYAIISNSIIVNNTAGYAGGGFSSGNGAKPIVINCTFAGNDAFLGPGCALGAGGAGGYATIVNSIFWNGSETEKEFAYTHAPPLVTYSLIKGGFNGEGNIACNPPDCNPRFVDELTGDFHLRTSSPCKDAGKDAGVYVDIDGDSRPQGLGFDIGADEIVVLLGPLLFSSVTPCRIVDTRKAGGAIQAGFIRSYNVRGAVASQGGNSAGCPSPLGEAHGVHVNVTAVPVAGSGNILAYPFGSTPPNASFVNYKTGVQNIANSAAIKTCYKCTKDISIKSNFGTAHVVIDVLGYYNSAP